MKLNNEDVNHVAFKVGASISYVGRGEIVFDQAQLNLFAESIQVLCYEQWNMELAEAELARLGETEKQLRKEFDAIDEERRESSYVDLGWSEGVHLIDGHFTTRQLEILAKLAKLRTK